jgi:hypothetical protein
MPRSYQVTLAILEAATDDTTVASQPNGDNDPTSQSAAASSICRLANRRTVNAA